MSKIDKKTKEQITADIYKATPIVEQMLNDRNYTKYEEIKNKIIFKHNQNDSKTVVHFIDNITKKDIEKHTKDIDVSKDIIIFIIAFIKNNTKLPSKYYSYENNYTQVFHIRNLLFNITLNKYVPKHIKLNQKDILELSNIYGLDKLAKIYTDDPMCKYLFTKENDILKIVRHSNNSKEEINYRKCIKRITI